jgi:hypothetical protein
LRMLGVDAVGKILFLWSFPSSILY